jgi:hypothetical protein
MDNGNIRVQWVTTESEAQAFAADAGKIAANVEAPKRWTPGPDEVDDYGDAMFEPLLAIVVIVGTGCETNGLFHRTPGIR